MSPFPIYDLNIARWNRHSYFGSSLSIRCCLMPSKPLAASLSMVAWSLLFFSLAFSLFFLAVSTDLLTSRSLVAKCIIVFDQMDGGLMFCWDSGSLFIPPDACLRSSSSSSSQFMPFLSPLRWTAWGHSFGLIILVPFFQFLFWISPLDISCPAQSKTTVCLFITHSSPSLWRNLD